MTREEVINGLKMSMELTLFDPSTGEVMEPWQLNDINRTAYDAYKGAIEFLEKQQWIPVEKRLPEPWDLVLVTDSCKNVGVCQMSRSDKNWYDENENWIYVPDSVIAWMLLPEYYREEG